MDTRFFIFGAGYSARCFASMNMDSKIHIAGTTRFLQSFDKLRSFGIEPFLFDGMILSSGIKEALHEVTHLIVSVPPSDSGDPVLNADRGFLSSMPQLSWICYLSSVGVYGDHRGAWIDEDSECRSLSESRIHVEKNWLRMGEVLNCPVLILRLSGIYGSGRNVFLRLMKGAAQRIIKPGHVFNRIHVEDIARGLWFLAKSKRSGVFNMTDDQPASSSDVVSFAAHLADLPLPPVIAFEKEDISFSLRRFYVANRRISNKRLKNEGFHLLYSDYRIGLTSMWKKKNWQSESCQLLTLS